LRIFTVGRSTRTTADLIQLLSVYQVTVLADVRSFPSSYRNPQFNQKTIEVDLSKAGIQYVWLQKLGGRRKGLGANSPNTCWKNRAFRNFADYTETSEFQEGIQELLKLANGETAAIMCAEAVYWKCHRSTIADFLKSEGIEVTHILDATHSKEHEYTQCARTPNGKLTYRGRIEAHGRTSNSASTVSQLARELTARRH
jgi:uncharacterized protein (DUF488 family)